MSTAATMAPELLNLPHEVLHSIFAYVDPADTARLSATCRALDNFLKADTFLYKELYLNHFDDPQEVFGQIDPASLKEKLQGLVGLEKSLNSTHTKPLDNIHEISSTVDYLLSTTDVHKKIGQDTLYRRPRNLAWLEERFNNELQQRRILTGSRLYTWASELIWNDQKRREANIGAAIDSEEQMDADTVDDQASISPEEEGNTLVEIDVDADGSMDEDDLQELIDLVQNGGSEYTNLSEEDSTESVLEPLQTINMKLADAMAQQKSQDSEPKSASGHDRRSPDPSLSEPQSEPPRFFNTKFSQETSPSQLCAKLHCLYGVPVQTVSHPSTTSRTSTTRYQLRSDTPKIHAFARSRVYDLRQHTEATLWGPFKSDGSRHVDWEKIEAVMLIIDHNLKQYSSATDLCLARYLPDWTTPFKGAHAYSYTPQRNYYHHSPSSAQMLIEPPLPLEAQDPYNVTGTWMRIICFLDYTELYDFNFSSVAQGSAVGQPRPPLDTEEAIRMIEMKIHVTKVEEPGEEDGKELPVVWFGGDSRAVGNHWDPNARSRIRGCVKLTKQGEVHWTSWSVFYGEERWRSEGIQIGGVQSGRGVLGFWFDKDYDAHGPAGPSAFWKLQDGVERRDGRRRSSEHESRSAFHMPLY